MAFCPGCDNEITSDAESCEKCGATFGSESAWKPLEQPRIVELKFRSWKLLFLGLFLLAIFVGTYKSIAPLSLPSNYSPPQQIFTYAFVYSPQFLAAFAVGMILSLAYAYGFITGQRGKAYRRSTWTRWQLRHFSQHFYFTAFGQQT